MKAHNLANTIDDLVIEGKGILAADESISTIGKRFDSISISNTEENRRQYRTLLCTTPKLSEYISGIILFEETLSHKDNKQNLLTDILSKQKIVPGIKVDKGLVDYPNHLNEKITDGLSDLNARMEGYKAKGARFAKWRNVYSITSNTPSQDLIKHNAETLATYAHICQQHDIVPIVEPEVLIDGDHSLEKCFEISKHVFKEVFNQLKNHQVKLEYILLKPSMVLPGKTSNQKVPADSIAEKTLQALKFAVPESVPSINFLSGGQSPVEATINLNAINSLGDQAWYLSFSYGRALQDPCLKAWQGKPENVEKAQQALYHRSKMNGLATLGQYRETME